MRKTGIILALIVLISGTPLLAEETPGPRNNAGRSNLGGIKGRITWQSLLSGKELDGWKAHHTENYPDNAWSREGDTVVGHIRGDKYGRIVTGDPKWRSYDLSVKATLVSGSNLQIAFRVSEDEKSYYFLDFLTGWKAVSITKKVGGVPGVTKLDVVNYPIEKGREYDITISVRDHSIISYIDGVRVNRLTDGSFPRGSVGFHMWHDTHVRFRDPRIQVYN